MCVVLGDLRDSKEGHADVEEPKGEPEMDTGLLRAHQASLVVVDRQGELPHGVTAATHKHTIGRSVNDCW